MEEQEQKANLVNERSTSIIMKLKDGQSKRQTSQNNSINAVRYSHEPDY